MPQILLHYGSLSERITPSFRNVSAQVNSVECLTLGGQHVCLSYMPCDDL